MINQSHLEVLESCLLASDAVADCSASKQVGEDGGEQVVVHAVLLRPWSLTDALAHLRDAGYAGEPPAHLVPVSSLAVGPDGSPDAAALDALALVDDALLARVEAKAAAIPGAALPVAVAHLLESESLPAHLADLLPDWDGDPGDSAQARAQAVSRADAAIVAGDAPPAEAHGGDLDPSRTTATTLPEALDLAAETLPPRTVVFVGAGGDECSSTYAAIRDRARHIGAGIRASGLGPGSHLLFQVRDEFDFVCAFWACQLEGIVPVPSSVAPSYSEENGALAKLRSAWNLLGQPPILTSAKMVASLRRGCEIVKMADASVVTIEALEAPAAGAPAAGPVHRAAPDDVALMLLTSGSTGVPKAVMLTHGNVIARSAGSAQVNCFTPDDVSLNWMPLDHVGGIVMFHVHDTCARCHQVQASTDYVLADPLRWLDLMERHRVSASWAPNFAYALVNDHAEAVRERRWDLSRVRYLLNGGEAVVARTSRKFLQMLAPHGLRPDAIHPAWGMSETSSGVAHSDGFHLDSTRDDDIHVSVGSPLPGTTFRIADADGHTLREGQAGRLLVRGPTVTKGYYGNPEATAESLLADGWLDTGDLARLDQGRLTITGRAKNVIIVNGVNYNSHEIEAVVDDTRGTRTSFSAACAVRRPGRDTDELAVFFSPERNDDASLREILRAVRENVLRAANIAPAYLVPLAPDRIPKTSIGKIQRAQLQRDFAAGAFAVEARHAEVLLGGVNTLPRCLYRPTWQRRGLPPAAWETLAGGVLVVGADSATIDAVCSKLRAAGSMPIAWQVGSDRESPSRAEALERLRTFANLGQAVSRIVWLVPVESFRQAGDAPGACAAMLALYQATSEANATLRPMRWLVAARFASAVVDGDVISIAQAGLGALARSIRQESPWLDCRVVDVGDLGPGEAAAALCAELEVHGRDVEVAYRGEGRHVPVLVPVPLETAARMPEPLRHGATYIITGGLGGIGSELASYLARGFSARLVLVGTRPLAESGAAAERLLRLRDAGADVRYVAADISDPDSLEKALADALGHGPAAVDGIFHLAGRYHEVPLLDETPDSLAEIVLPKAAGTANVLAWRDRHAAPAFVCAFSSQIGVFGAPLAAAYAAANRCLDACIAGSIRRGRRDYALAWTAWRSTGMSDGQDTHPALRAMGILDLAVDHALAALRVALRAGPGSMVIGLDPDKAFVRRQCVLPSQGQSITVYHEGHSRLAPESVFHDVADERGRPTRVLWQPVERMPLDHQGHPDRALLARGADAHSGQRATAPRNATERRLAEIWRRVLSLYEVDVTANFFELGGHSLLATRLLAGISDAFGLNWTLRDIFTCPSIEEQAALIAEQTAGAQAGDILPADRGTVLPLSFAQHRLWFLDRLEPGNPMYHVPATLRFSGPLSLAALQKALDWTVARHEALRTVFPVSGGEPCQRVLPPAAVRLGHDRCAPLADEAFEETVVRTSGEEAAGAFDLASGPPLRARVVSYGDERHVLFLTIHHIVTDGWSMKLLFREIPALYDQASRGEPMPPAAPIQYPDYALWQRQWLDSPASGREMEFWRSRLNGVTSGLELAADFPRPAVQDFRGRRRVVIIPAECAKQVGELAQRHGVTPFMVALAAFKVLLHRLTDQDDVVIGTVAANRLHAQVESMVGLLINVVVLRTDLGGNPAFLDCLERVRKTVVGTFEHQELPFERLLQELQVTRDLARAPLFQVAFDFRDPEITVAPRPGVQVGVMEPDLGIAKYDLQLTLQHRSDGLAAIWEYATGLFEPETIDRIGSAYVRLLESVVENPRGRVRELALVRPAEAQRLLDQWSGSGRPVAGADTTLHARFAEVAARMPEAAALADSAGTLDYAALARLAGDVARRLRRSGVKRGEIVAVCVPRGREMVAALLGVLEAGAAYLPLDPSYPRERLAYMLEDSGAVQLIAVAETAPALPETLPPVILLDAPGGDAPPAAPADPAGPVRPDDLAYVIYTSGSTGRPKGAMIEHRSACNLALAQAEAFRIGPGKRVIQFAAFGFDASVSEIFTALLTGATLCLPTREQAMPGQPLASYLAEQGVTTATLPPSVLRVLDETGLGNLDTVVSAGEACDAELVGRWSRGRRFINAYGPTETTVCATLGVCDPSDVRPPSIGRPLEGARVYILDDARQPVPPGVLGEIWVGGVGVGRGYLGRPELTAERFVPDPHAVEPGARMYRTGDVARLRNDGAIEYVGRRDSQVKVRGFRIELGEIEAAMRSHPLVRDAVVLAFGDDPAERQLAAFVVPANATASRGEGSDAGGMLELWPSVAEFFVYDEVIYFAMTHDERRNAVYKAAINELVRDKVVLDIGTGRDAILARFCAEAGARKVYAFEIMEESFKAARATVERLGLQDRIEVILTDSRKASLPEPIDVCVSEIVGAIGGSEGAALIINDAWRFMKPGGAMIPSRSRTLIAAASLPQSFLEAPRFSELSGHYVRRIFDQVGYRFDLRLSLRNAGYEHVISEVGVFEDLDYTRQIPPEEGHDIRLRIERDGPVSGFLVWLTLETMPGHSLDILEHEYCWLPVFLPAFDPPLPLRAGDLIEGRIERTLWTNGLNPDFRITGAVRRGDAILAPIDYAAHHADRSYRQTPFYQRLFEGDAIPVKGGTEDLSVPGLARYLSRSLPDWMVPSEVVLLDRLPLTANGKIDRAALPAPGRLKRSAAPAGASAPRNDTERAVADVWQAVLGLEHVPRSENFFDLGGHSLRMSVAHGMLVERLGRRDLTLVDMFKYPSVATLAEFLDGSSSGTDRAEADRESARDRMSQGRDRLQQMAARRGTGRRPVEQG